MDVERRLDQLGLTLPAEAALPAGVEIPFAWVRIRGTRAYVSGHGALAADGSPAGPFGKIPSEVTLEEAQHSALFRHPRQPQSDARRSLNRLLDAWLMVNGYVNAEPGYPQTTAVLNPSSETQHRPVRNRHRKPRPYRHRGRHCPDSPAGRHLGRSRDRRTDNAEARRVGQLHRHAQGMPIIAFTFESSLGAKPQRTGPLRVHATLPMLHTHGLSRSPQTVPINTEAADQTCWSAACAFATRREKRPYLVAGAGFEPATFGL